MTSTEKELKSLELALAFFAAMPEAMKLQKLAAHGGMTDKSLWAAVKAEQTPISNSLGYLMPGA